MLVMRKCIKKKLSSPTACDNQTFEEFTYLPVPSPLAISWTDKEGEITCNGSDGINANTADGNSDNDCIMGGARRCGESSVAIMEPYNYPYVFQHF